MHPDGIRRGVQGAADARATYSVVCGLLLSAVAAFAVAPGLFKGAIQGQTTYSRRDVNFFMFVARFWGTWGDDGTCCK
eukprot:5421298-Pyramimonas_sp.AAC.1